MNKVRRKELNKIIDELNAIKNKDDLYSCINILARLRDEEQDYYDNIPENLQYGQRAEASEHTIDSLDEAIDLLNEIYDDEKEFDKDDKWIKDAIDKIDDAIWSY